MDASQKLSHIFLGGWGPSKLSTGHHIPQQLRKGIASRSNGHGNDLQYHAKDSLRQLRIRLPMDGFCMLGVTMCDLFHSTHSFVHSSVSVPWKLKRKSGRTMEDWGFGAMRGTCNYSHPLRSSMKENYSIPRLSCQQYAWPRNVKKTSEPR